jgi:prepilin-type N-terminal cleavage/methylation domain-containing protein
VQQLKYHESWRSERGFTLPELMVVIALMGIMLAIATSSWFDVVESRRVDSSTNQMVSDLRLAHTRATNRLESWRLQWSSGSASYQIGPGTSAGFAGTPSSRTLEEGTKLTGTVSSVVFNPNGTAQIAGDISVAAADGAPTHAIQVNTVTSRIKVVN